MHQVGAIVAASVGVVSMILVAISFRNVIILKLETTKTLTVLANSLKINLLNVSQALTELENKKIVVCLTLEKNVG